MAILPCFSRPVSITIPIDKTSVSRDWLTRVQDFFGGAAKRKIKKTLGTPQDFVNCTFSLKLFYWKQIFRGFLVHCQKFSPVRAFGIFHKWVSAEIQSFAFFSPQLRTSCFWRHTQKGYIFPMNCNQQLFF